MRSRKIYHSHGFLVQYWFKKKGWVDWKGVANNIDTVLEMGGDPKSWTFRPGSAGLSIDREYTFGKKGV